jgi:hypothetical protein
MNQATGRLLRLAGIPSRFENSLSVGTRQPAPAESAATAHPRGVVEPENPVLLPHHEIPQVPNAG